MCAKLDSLEKKFLKKIMADIFSKVMTTNHCSEVTEYRTVEEPKAHTCPHTHAHPHIKTQTQRHIHT